MCGTKLVLLAKRYWPTQPLGSGGFSKTYSAEDRLKLNEHCVIKQFNPQIQGKQTLQKAQELFEREAKQLKKLGVHPQIPALQAYFKDTVTVHGKLGSG